MHTHIVVKGYRVATVPAKEITVRSPAALVQETAHTSGPCHLTGDNVAPAIGIVVAGLISVVLWASLLLLARWLATTFF